ncbi:MAG: hypothetical protein HA489_07685 [Archaeoglobales archaeon]|nr:hypothetical protein [Archaeoglobales archaeon]
MLIKIGAQKTQSFSSGMNGQSLGDVPLQRKAQICDMNIAHALTRGMG